MKDIIANIIIGLSLFAAIAGALFCVVATVAIVSAFPGQSIIAFVLLAIIKGKK